METHTLIKWLDDIDNKLRNKYVIKENSFIGRLSGERIELPPRRENKYSIDELMTMWDRKLEIITELNKRGLIDDKEWKKFMLSENDQFTPKLKAKTL